MRVALIRLSALGDIVHTWPLAAALRAGQPSLHLTWVVERPFVPLVEHHPAVDDVVVADTHRWRRQPFASRTWTEVKEFRRRLRALSCEVAIDAQGVLKSAAATWWTGAPRRFGLERPWRREALAGAAYTETIPGSRSQRHVVATNLELARAIGCTPPQLSPPDGRWLATLNRGRAPAHAARKPFAVLFPAAGHPAKVLSSATLVEIASGITRLGLDVLVVWGPGEEQRATTIAAAAGQGTHLAPPTDLHRLVAVLSEAFLAVGSDTGPIHLAASLGIPTVAVFITTSARRNCPLGDHVCVVAAADDSDQPPSGSAHAYRVRSVQADEVVTAARSVLGLGHE